MLNNIVPLRRIAHTMYCPELSDMIQERFQDTAGLASRLVDITSTPEDCKAVVHERLFDAAHSLDTATNIVSQDPALAIIKVEAAV